jgi:1,4-alpha-glucan branching enzyme
MADLGAVEGLLHGLCRAPFDILGIHRLVGSDEGGVVLRAFLPWASEATVVHDGRRVPLQRTHPDGLFEAAFPEDSEPFPYEIEAVTEAAEAVRLDDPYRFGPVLDPDRISRFLRGHDQRIFEYLGAHPMEHEGVFGTCFAVWAPNAHNVNLIGDFNAWDGRCHPMRCRGRSGVWELFLPGVREGALYKYEIRTTDGHRLEKADPVGFAMELRPATASVVADLDRYEWGDGDWLSQRSERQGSEAPISIFEAHLGSWRRRPDRDPSTDDQGWLGYRELAEKLLPYVKEMGYTHIELLPVSEHPLDQSWGYQTVGYFAPTSRFGSPDDFRFFVDRAHALGLAVILDWVPAHFPNDAHGLARFDGPHLYEHADPRRGAHPDWGTAIFDYGRPEVMAFLVSSALFWIEGYHVDGLRVDAVASMLYLDYSRAADEWVPNIHGGRENLEAMDLLRRMNDVVHAEAPGVLTFAEESTAWPQVSRPTSQGGLGFDMKWNMGWMHDTLESLQTAPAEREQLANLRLLLAYQYGHPGKKLLFMGGEIGVRDEWQAEGELDWSLLESEGHRGLQRFVRDLNRIYGQEPALHEVDFSSEGFEWIDCHDPDRTTLSFLRWASDHRDVVIVAANFGPAARERYRLGVPTPGLYRAILDTDAVEYAGAGSLPAPGELEAVAEHHGGRPAYLELTLPPLTVLYFKPVKPAD